MLILGYIIFIFFLYLIAYLINYLLNINLFNYFNINLFLILSFFIYYIYAYQKFKLENEEIDNDVPIVLFFIFLYSFVKSLFYLALIKWYVILPQVKSFYDFLFFTNKSNIQISLIFIKYVISVIFYFFYIYFIFKYWKILLSFNQFIDSIKFFIFGNITVNKVRNLFDVLSNIWFYFKKFLSYIKQKTLPVRNLSFEIPIYEKKDILTKTETDLDSNIDSNINNIDDTNLSDLKEENLNINPSTEIDNDKIKENNIEENTEKDNNIVKNVDNDNDNPDENKSDILNLEKTNIQDRKTFLINQLKKKWFVINDNIIFDFNYNLIFLNQDAIKFKEELQKYVNEIWTSKDVLQKEPNIKNDSVFFIYYDKVFGLIIIPKFLSKFTEFVYNKDSKNYYDFIFLKDVFSPEFMQENKFVEIQSQIEIINSQSIYYILLKHQYDPNDENRTWWYVPFNLSDILQVIYWNERKSKLLRLQNINEYTDMTEEERSQLLIDRYSVIFGKRKLVLKDINKDYVWDNLNKKLIVYKLITTLTHILIAGKTNSWKSVLLRNVLYSFLTKNNENSVEIWIADRKDEFIKELYKFKHVTLILNDDDKIYQMIKYAVYLMEKRKKQIKEGWNIQFKKTGKLIKPLIIVIEEFQEMLESKPEIISDIKKIVLKWRSSWIYLIPIMQAPEERLLSGILNQFTVVTAATDKDNVSEKLSGFKGFLTSLRRGEVFFKDSVNKYIIRVPYESADDYVKYFDEKLLIDEYKAYLQWQITDEAEIYTKMALKYKIDIFKKMFEFYLKPTLYDVLLKYEENIAVKFLFFELFYLYLVLVSKINIDDYIVRIFILKNLLNAINYEEIEFNIHLFIKSNPSEWIKSLSNKIVDDFKKIFLNKKWLFAKPNKNLLFDPDIENKINSLLEAWKEVPETLQQLIDPEIKISALIQIIDQLIFDYKKLISEDEILEFYKNNSDLLQYMYNVNIDLNNVNTLTDLVKKLLEVNNTTNNNEIESKKTNIVENIEKVEKKIEEKVEKIVNKEENNEDDDIIIDDNDLISEIKVDLLK